jgi:branched-chain amino acid transport system permease protein
MTDMSAVAAETEESSPVGGDDPGLPAALEQHAEAPPPAWGRVALTWGIRLLLGLAILLFLRSWANDEWIDVLNRGFIAGIGALGLNLLLGHTGLVSIGNAAFLGIGAVTAAQVAIYLEWPIYVAVLLGGLGAAAVGLVVAIPSLRIKGLYLAIGTLALQYVIVDWALRSIQTNQVGDGGYIIPRTTLFGLDTFDIKSWYWPLAVLMVVALLVSRSLIRTKPGRAWHAIRERPPVAQMSGISVWRYKIWAFVISSFFIGVGGALTAYYIGNVSYTNFTLQVAIDYLVMVIVGGLGSTYGPIFGAMFVVALPRLIDDARGPLHLDAIVESSDIFLVQGVLAGLAVVLMILLEPRGLASLATRIWAFLVDRVGRLRRAPS